MKSPHTIKTLVDDWQCEGADNVHELADTLFHEALHTCGGTYGGHDPGDEGGTAGVIAKMCGLTGSDLSP